VDLDTTFDGFKIFFAGEGLFLLRLIGPGRAFLSSFGAIDEFRLGSGEQYVVDTGRVVAFESSIPYSVRRVGSLTSTVLSGEGLVVEYEGQGTVRTQSRSPDVFLSWIAVNAPSGTGAVAPVDYSSDSTPGKAGAVVAPPGGDSPNAGKPSRTGGKSPRGGGDHRGRAEIHRSETEAPRPENRGTSEIAGRHGSRVTRMQESVDRNRGYVESGIWRIVPSEAKMASTTR
jgi:hypothetical protein